MVLDESRSIAEVARATGVNPGTLGNWVGHERVERGERDGLTADERSDLAELRARDLVALLVVHPNLVETCAHLDGPGGSLSTWRPKKFYVGMCSLYRSPGDQPVHGATGVRAGLAHEQPAQPSDDEGLVVGEYPEHLGLGWGTGVLRRFAGACFAAGLVSPLAVANRAAASGSRAGRITSPGCRSRCWLVRAVAAAGASTNTSTRRERWGAVFDCPRHQFQLGGATPASDRDQGLHTPCLPSQPGGSCLQHVGSLVRLELRLDDRAHLNLLGSDRPLRPSIQDDLCR